ncbi:MAG: hypothetical protein ACR2K1_06775 [Saprospiraceae bacterium]
MQAAAVVMAGVEFGTLTQDGRCVNFGICKVTTDQANIVAFQKSRCRAARALIALDADARLQFYFPAADMLPCTARAIFAAGYFPVPSDFVLPAELRAQLPQNAPLRIAAGKYLIIKTTSGYRVQF